MRRICSVLLAVIVFVFFFMAWTSEKKYDIKSGIVTYEQIMKMGKMEIKEKIVVYFDDYGMKECKDTYSDDKVEESYLSDGKDLYIVKPKQKKAFRQGTASRGTELRVEWTEFGTEADRKAGKYKKLTAMTVAGKNCEVFEYNDGEGTITRYGGWNKILLYMDLQTKSTQSTQRAVKVEENVTISPDKFKVPAGFAVQ
jgi:hypothetical protein